MAGEREIRIGAVTIGQSPRNDLVPEMSRIMGSRLKLIECGALDDYSYEEIVEKFGPGKEPGKGPEDSMILVSRLRDGREVRVVEKEILPLLQQCIDSLEDAGAEALVLLCTGELQGLNHSGLFIEPHRLLKSLIISLLSVNLLSGEPSGEILGIIIPSPEQCEQVREAWADIGITVKISAVSPYQELNQFKEAVSSFDFGDASLIYLDCMGYTGEMKKVVQEVSRKRVILPRTVIASLLSQLF